MPSLLNCFKSPSSKPEKPDKSSTTSSAISNAAPTTTTKASKYPTSYSTETSFHTFHRGYHYPCKPRDTPIDIIAVHGTLGDANTTWDRGDPYPDSNWLTHPLSYQMPGARIFGFGYDANVFWSADSVTEGLDEIARGLLENISEERRWGEQDKKRPIIFICHSLGGVLIKKALHLASQEEKYTDLLNRVFGTVFLGTPHRSCKETTWTKILENIAKATPSTSPFHITNCKHLTTASQVIELISNDFVNLKLNVTIKIASFIEQEPTAQENKKRKLVLVLDKETSTLGTPNEHIRAMHGTNHVTMSNFSNLGYGEETSMDRNFQRISHVIHYWSQVALGEVQWEDDGIDWDEDDV